MKKRIILFSAFLLLYLFVFAIGEDLGHKVVPAKPGEQNENVRLIQEKLVQLSYLNTNPSGNYLEQTKAAVQHFQKDNQLNTSGIVDDETAALLNKIRFRELKAGMQSKAVALIQERLIEQGYLHSKATGNFKTQTVNAIKEFQKDNGIPETGIADVATQELLFTQSAVDKNEEPLAVTDGRTYDVQNIAFESKLRRASEGEAVKKVQARLKELGFFDGPISGYYMNQTVAAMKKFQSYNGLIADGLTDQNTWDVLFNQSDVVDSMSTPAPTPEPVLPKYAITVDVTNQAVLVYERDEKDQYTKLVRKMICSTGTKKTPSDVGDWVLNGRKAKWCYFPAYGSHAKFWTQINKYIAFHSVIYTQVDNMSLSVSSYNHLGHRASHGCIRLMVHDSKWIYDNIEKGTVVSIREDLPVDEELRNAIKKPALNKTVMLPVSTPEPTVEPVFKANEKPPMPLESLRKNSSGEAVFWLQSTLKEKGYYTGTITGSYYAGTVDAVKKFQKENNMYPSGTADVETLQALYHEVLQPEVAPTASIEVIPQMTPAPIALP